MHSLKPIARLSRLRPQRHGASAISVTTPSTILNPHPRNYSSTTTNPSSAQPTTDAKQLSHYRARIGKCFFAGLPASHLERAGAVLKVLTLEWRELLAGSEGYLTQRARQGAGLWRRRVEWGDMVSESASCVVCVLGGGPWRTGDLYGTGDKG